MKQNINIEAEGNELILKNKAGDYVIIPKKYRLEVQDMIKENCHSCIDELVETLPVMEDYAEDGTVFSIPPNTFTAPSSTIQSANQNVNSNLIGKTREDIPQYNPGQTFIGPDNRTDYERQRNQEAMNAYQNPGFVGSLLSGARMVTRAVADPIQGIGQVFDAVGLGDTRIGQDLGNFNDEEAQYRYRNLNPNINAGEKFMSNLGEGSEVAAYGATNFIPFESSVINPIVKGLVGKGNYSSYLANQLYTPITNKEIMQFKPVSKVVGKTDDVVKPIVSPVQSIVENKVSKSSVFKKITKNPHASFKINDYIKEVAPIIKAAKDKNTIKSISKLNDDVMNYIKYTIKDKNLSANEAKRLIKEQSYIFDKMKKEFPNIDDIEIYKRITDIFDEMIPFTERLEKSRKIIINNSYKQQLNVNVKKYFNRLQNEIDRKMQKINNSVFKDILEESPQYLDEIYNHSINPLTTDEIFVDNLIKQSNTFKRALSTNLENVDDIKVLKGRSLSEGNKSTIDVEGLYSSGNYGKHIYLFEPDDAFMEYIENLPLNQKWANRRPKYIGKDINLKEGWLTQLQQPLRDYRKNKITDNLLQTSDIDKIIYSNIPKGKAKSFIMNPHKIFSTNVENNILQGFKVKKHTDKIMPLMSKGYSIIPFYLYLQSQNQNKNEQ